MIRLGDAAGRTGLLAAGLALSSAGLVAALPSRPLLQQGVGVRPVLLAVALAGLFVLAEQHPLHIEIRREAMSVTLAGVPLALGVLLVDPRLLIAARLLGALATFLHQRGTPLKIAYNLAAYAFETALTLALLHLLIGQQTSLDIQVAASSAAVLMGVDQLMGLLVVQVISWHQGRPSLAEVAALQSSGLLGSALATTSATGLLLLSTHGTLGLLVIIAFAGIVALAYRSFQTLHRRHQALAHVHEFVALNDHAGTVTDLAGVLLGQIRALMRAQTAELVITDPDPDLALHLSVDEDDTPRLVPGRRGQDHRDLTSIPQSGTATLLARNTRDRGLRRWLLTQGVSDAVIAPLTSTDGSQAGALLVLNRLGDTGSFTAEDQTLLATLAGHLSIAVDSARRRERLHYEATHDVLTGLGNRALLSAAITQNLAVGRPRGSVVLLLDLDRFKEVNDTLGHHVGDALLTVVAQRLRHALPADATISRLGGDEFAALIPEPPCRTAANQADGADRATDLAQTVAAALATTIELDGTRLSTQASVGVTITGPGSTAAELLRHADTAMYAAKATRTGHVLYTPELDRGRAERLALLADLHLALERDELTVLYQPKLNLTAGRITSVEALVRWQHPRLGTLGPDAFIPLAETDGLVAPLTRIVLDQALHQCAAWRRQDLDVAVAVNLSARVVTDPDLPEQITAALLNAGLPPTSLILEITETAVMDDPQRAVTTLQRLAAIGVQLSLDDFGTGYSSLAYLQQLPVSEVKIDRSFITGLTANDSRSQVLVRAIINLAHSLNLQVVAEGVEDAATLELLQDLGCHLIQGYHVGRPQTPRQLDVTLTTSHTAPLLRLAH